MVDLYPCFTFGPTTTAATCPPPCEVSDVAASSNTIIRMPSPPVWNGAVESSGAMFVFNQVSAVASEQSCASLHLLGMTNEKSGNCPFARSVLNWLKDTRCCRSLLL